MEAVFDLRKPHRCQTLVEMERYRAQSKEIRRMSKHRNALQQNYAVVLCPTKTASKSSLKSLGIAIPIYDTQGHDGYFISVVTVDGQSFRSDGLFKAKKPAEQIAASIAPSSLVAIPHRSFGTSMCTMHLCSTPTPTDATMLHDPQPSPTFDSLPNLIDCTEFQKAEEEKVSWKNLLQEHMQLCGMGLPVYETTVQGK